MKQKKEQKIQPSVAQFIHAEGYTVSKAVGICGEVTREVGYCPHITNQRTKEHPPLYLIGDEQGIRELGQDIISKSKTVKRSRIRNGKELKQKIQEGENVFLAGVTTIKKELGDDPAYLMAWAHATTEYLKEKYKDHLQAVVLHSDESHYDIHFIVVNEDLNPSLDAEWFQHRQNKELSKKEVRRLENESLRAFQDDYFNKVASEFGLDRLGQQSRPRDERPDYLARKNAELLEAQARIRSQQEAENLKQRFENLTKDLEQTQEKLAKNREEINAKKPLLEELDKKEKELKQEAEKIEQQKAQAKQEAEKIIKEAAVTAEVIISEGKLKQEEYITLGKKFAKQEKLYTESAVKKEDEIKQLKKEQEKIVNDLKSRREKEENGLFFNVIRICKRAMHSNEIAKEKNFWVEKFNSYKRQAEEIVTRWKNAFFAEQSAKKDIEKELNQYKAKYGELETPKNEARLDKNNDINVRPDDYGSGSGGYGM